MISLTKWQIEDEAVAIVKEAKEIVALHLEANSCRQSEKEDLIINEISYIVEEHEWIIYTHYNWQLAAYHDEYEFNMSFVDHDNNLNSVISAAAYHVLLEASLQAFHESSEEAAAE